LKVLHVVLKDLKAQLNAWAAPHVAAGDLGNDGSGSWTILENYHDDGGLLDPYCDFKIYLPWVWKNWITTWA
jgi:hypothetical protein